jgi:hypothetical protein
VESDLQGFPLLLVLLPPQRMDLNTCRIERGVDMVVILLEMGMGVVELAVIVVELAVMVVATRVGMVAAIPVTMGKVVIMAMDETIATEREIAVASIV